MITGFVHQVQLSVLIKAVGMGYFLGLLFYILSILFCSFGKNTVIVFIRDTVFFIAAAFLSFIFSLKYCSGMIRFYVTAGELMGFLIFCIYPGKQIMKVLYAMLGAINRKTEKIRTAVYTAVSEKRKKLKIILHKKSKSNQSDAPKKSKKMYMSDMTKKLLKHTKKSQKN